MLYLSIWAGMLKKYCHICNQRPPIFLIVKFHAKITILKVRTKSTLFGCFGQQFSKSIFIFQSNALEFSLLQSLVQKIKILKSGTTNVRFAYFGARILKYYCYIWNQSPQICLAANFGSKISLNFGTKNIWFEYFCARSWK